LIIRKVAPIYPSEAKAARVQGTVLLHAIIGNDGNIAHLEVISGPASLVDAATDAVRQWQYRTYPLQGKPVEVETEIQVNFELR
jgi:protein TonB